MSLEIGMLRGSGSAPGNDNLLQYLRMPAAAVNASVEVVRHLCAVANDSQSFYRSASSKQWLRTVVSLFRYKGEVLPQDPQKIDVFSFGVVAFQVLTGAVNLYVKHRPCDVPDAVLDGTRPSLELDQLANLDGTCSLSMLPLVRAENSKSDPLSLRFAVYSTDLPKSTDSAAISTGVPKSRTLICDNLGTAFFTYLQ